MLVGVESQCGHLLCPPQKHRLSWSGWRRRGSAFRWRKHILQQVKLRDTTSWHLPTSDPWLTWTPLDALHRGACDTERCVWRTRPVKGGASYSRPLPMAVLPPIVTMDEWRLVWNELNCAKLLYITAVPRFWMTSLFWKSTKSNGSLSKWANGRFPKFSSTSISPGLFCAWLTH